jgi:transaldolase
MRIILLAAAYLPLAHGFELRGNTRFFLDTADVAEYAALLPLGIFHGVTTNPTILQRAGVPCTVPEVHGIAQRAFDHGAFEFMCQAWGGSTEKLVATGKQLCALDRQRVVVKVPITAAGVEAAARLMREDGARICMTACYSSTQALLAGAAGAEYLAPYLGRMSDSGKDGFAECARMGEIVAGLGCGTRILVASIRDVEAMAGLACTGLDTFTFSPDIARALFDVPLTDAAAAAFEEAAAGSPSV